MPKPTWEIFVGILCAVIVFVVPIVLYLMEKAGINIIWIVVVGWISIAVACLYLVLNIPWVWKDGNIGIQVWRACFVSAAALLAAGYGATKIWPHTEQAAVSATKEPYELELGPILFATQSHNTEEFWIRYQGPHGNTASRCDVVLYISLKNNQSVPVNIQSYSVGQKTETGQWVWLGQRVTHDFQVYFAGNDIHHSRRLELISFDNIVNARAIAPGETIKGWAFFVYRIPIPNDVGPFLPIFRVAFIDSTGTNWTSPELTRPTKNTGSGGVFSPKEEYDLTKDYYEH